MSKRSISDMVSDAKLIVACSTETVWPFLLDQQSWMKDFTIMSVAGERNQVGEIKKVIPAIVDPQSFSVDEVHPFYFKTLTLIPFRKFVYKAYTEHRGGEYSFTGVEILSLTNANQNSLVTFDAYLEFQSETMDEKQLDSFVAQVRQGSKDLWERNFQRLNDLIIHPARPN